MPQPIFFNRHFHKLHYWFKMLHIELFFLLLSSVGGNAKTPMRQHRGFVLELKNRLLRRLHIHLNLQTFVFQLHLFKLFSKSFKLNFTILIVLIRPFLISCVGYLAFFHLLNYLQWGFAHSFIP